MRKPDPKVLVLPSALLLELFALSRYASRFGNPADATKILSALRVLRPDIPEFSAFLALSLLDEGKSAEGLEILEAYRESGAEVSSLVFALLAKLRFERSDPDWFQAAVLAVRAAEIDGGGQIQDDLLSELPFDVALT